MSHDKKYLRERCTRKMYEKFKQYTQKCVKDICRNKQNGLIGPYIKRSFSLYKISLNRNLGSTRYI